MALPAPLVWVRRVYRWLHRGWESKRVQHLVATALVIIFVGALILIELRRLGLVRFSWLPSNHFHAVRLGFNLLLVVEVVGLVFGLTGTPGRTLGRGIALAAAYPSTAEAPRPPEPVAATARELEPRKARQLESKRAR